MGKSLDELDSTFRPFAEQLIAKANAQGLDVVIEDTGRSEDDQREKLATGVSWTLHSMHLPQPPEDKSKAIDLVPRVCMTLKYWGWNGKFGNSHPFWFKLVVIGRSLGLECGGDWVRPDPGHFQTPRGGMVTKA